MTKNATALPLTDVLLEHWERPRRMAEEKATDLEEQLKRTKADLEKADLVKSSVKANKREWKEKARDLQERLARSERRAEQAQAKVEEGVARIAAAEEAVRELRLKVEDKERRIARGGTVQRRRRTEGARTRERRDNALKRWLRYTGSGV